MSRVTDYIASGVGVMSDPYVEARARRATHLQLADIRVLHAWGVELRAMFNATAYLVGSSLTRPDFRDVDVRIVLDDVAVDAVAGVMDLGRLAIALSLWGRHVTGLPIDCQIQPRSESDAEGGMMHPLGQIPGRLDRRAWPAELEPVFTLGLAPEVW